MRLIRKYLYMFVFISLGIVPSCFFMRNVFYDKIVCKNVNIANATLRSVSGYLTDSKWHERGNTKCQPENTPGKHVVPHKIIQYGVGGTATTLQFQILCVLMALLHAADIEYVGCYYGNDAPLNYTVTKIHFVRDLVLQLSPANSWIFMTFSDYISAEKKEQYEFDKRKFQNMKFQIPYIADINMVSKRGYYIVYDYQSIFGISNEKMKHAVEYLRYWDILRICCGKQMSADWRRHLSPLKNYIQHHDPHGPLYPACEMYNISVVESLLMKTYIFQHYSHIHSLHNVIGKPSNVDGDIDGHYCARCNKNITEKQLGFNENCA